MKENLTKKNTKDITFSELKLSEYLSDNRNKSLSQIIFAVRSKTFDVKLWQEWKYQDGLCVMCQKDQEDMDHFVNCKHYETEHEGIDWKQILENHVEKQYEIAEFIYNQQVERERE